MNNPFIKIGSIGSVITAICCFTPSLVWVLGMIGLSAMVSYLDFFLLPLLGIFLLVFGFGVFRVYRDRGQ